MPKINFVRENENVTVNAGSNIRKVALERGYSIYRGFRKIANCHGLGLCGTCVIEVPSGIEKLSLPSRSEEKLLAKQNLSPDRFRLACQCYVHQSVKVKTLG